jgi:hypothetical protein
MRMNRSFSKDLLNPKIKYLITIYHYAIPDGEKKRFILPNLVSGDQVLETVRSLTNTNNVFRIALRYTNFPHIDWLFSEICNKHDQWSSRLEAFENRIPYLQLSNLSPQELELL